MFALRQLPRGLREEQLAQEAEYAAIFKRLIDEAEEKGLWRAGFNLAVVRHVHFGTFVFQEFLGLGQLYLLKTIGGDNGHALTFQFIVSKK